MCNTPANAPGLARQHCYSSTEEEMKIHRDQGPANLFVNCFLCGHSFPLDTMLSDWLPCARGSGCSTEEGSPNSST